METIGQSIPHRFFATARVRGTAPAFYDDAGGTTVGYDALARRAAATAAAIAAAGAVHGDYIALVAENGPAWAAAYFGILAAGCVAVPIDMQLGPAELANIFGNAGPLAVLHSVKTLQTVTAAAAEYATRTQHTTMLLDLAEVQRALPQESPAAAGDADTWKPGALASIIYTSGTTGVPKGVMLTHANFCSDADALIAAGLVSAADNVLSVLPLHHTYAFMCTMLVPLFLGASITCPASLKGPDIMESIRSHGVTVLIGVPQLLALIRDGILRKMQRMPQPLSFALMILLRLSGALRRRYDLNVGKTVFSAAHRALGAGFRFFGSGGARLDPAVMQDLEALGFTVLEGYGLTETAPVVTFNPMQRRKPGSAGMPLPSVEIRILDPSATGEGEIAVRGPMVMQGYHRNPGATAAVLQDGWFRTGDLGRIDADGYLFITGRSKEVIVLGSGKNIYPEDVEKLYSASPLIRELCVLGRTGQGGAESLHAVIVPDLEYARAHGIVNMHEAVKWELNDRAVAIPSYMRVTGFSLRSDPLPRTPLGKLRRFIIEEELRRAGETARGPAAAGGLPDDAVTRLVAAALRPFMREGMTLRLDDDLELDIGLDSLAKIELVAGLEESLQAKFPDQFLAGIHTVGELIERSRTVGSADISPDRSAGSGWAGILGVAPSARDLGKVYFDDFRSRRYPLRLAFGMIGALFRLFVCLEVRGRENIPQDRNCILAPNHTSYLDGPAVVFALTFEQFRRTYSLGLSDFFTGPVKGWVARLGNVIPLDTERHLNKALQMAAHVLRLGRSLSLFPEGGRSFDGRLLEFKKGVGILAVELGVPVVPVCIEGAFEILPRSAFFPRPGRIRITFGKPLIAAAIDPAARLAGMDTYQYFANVLRERVQAMQSRDPLPRLR